MAFSLDFRIHSEVDRVRKNNQDAAFASPNLLVVADGMGGAAAGDLASAVAATEASHSDRRLEGEQLLENMAGIMQRANDKLADLIEQDLELDGMGTTFSGASFSGTTFGVAHIGDSRGYLLHGDEIRQLTHDHSWVQALIDDGRLTPEQAATHPHRSLILKVLNGSGETDPDFFELEAEEGDVLLFCSDGLSGLVPESELKSVIDDNDLDEAVTKLAALANERGGHDNITMVIARVVPQSDELDAATPQLAGSAVEREIPSIGHEEEGSGYPDPEAEAETEAEGEANQDPDHDESEQARYAPRASRPRWPTTLAAFLAVTLVIGVVVWGVFAYSRSRYFIAAADGHVGIYNGIPGALFGLQMNRLVERRDTLLSDLPAFYQRQVSNTIGVSDFDAAVETAQKLDDYARRCAAVRSQRFQKPTSPAEPEGSPGVGLPTPTDSLPAPTATPGQTNYPTLLAPLTPSTTQEADPEAC